MSTEHTEEVEVIDPNGKRKKLPKHLATSPDVIAAGFRPLSDILPEIPVHQEQEPEEKIEPVQDAPVNKRGPGRPKAAK